MIKTNQDFSFETTLASTLFARTIDKAKSKGYYITLIFFWLESISLAKDRVKKRVSEGGHHVEDTIIERRYLSGIKNLFSLYCHKVDSLLIYDNSLAESSLIAEKVIEDNVFTIYDVDKFNVLKRLAHEH